MTVVVADAAPLHYLIQVGYEQVLPRLFTKVWIPGAVAEELQQEHTPSTVYQWAQHPPSWIEIIEIAGSASGHDLAGLDRGEWEAIALARELNADLLLMDERAGVRAARRQGLTVTGTLGVMVEAARTGLLSIDEALTPCQKRIFVERQNCSPKRENWFVGLEEDSQFVDRWLGCRSSSLLSSQSASRLVFCLRSQNQRSRLST